VLVKLSNFFSFFLKGRNVMPSDEWLLTQFDFDLYGIVVLG